jgi:hypothetical protein
MRAVLHLTLIIAVAFASAAAWAQTPESGGKVIIGAQTTDEDGDREKFREDNLGEQGGVFLELFDYRSFGETTNFEINARYTSGQNGWLDLEAIGAHWAGGVRTTIVTAWSDTSFADDFLPSGTPVSALFPGTTTLDPLFGVSSPRQEYLVGEAWATYRFSGSNRLTLRAGASRLDGERVPNIGGFSFSDVGTASLYTAGLETSDSSASWLELEGLFRAGPIDIRLEGGTLGVDTERQVSMPAYGAASLLDLDRWNDISDTDTTHLRLDLGWLGSRIGLYGSVAYADISTDPGGGDLRVDESGALVQGGLNVDGGSIDVETVAGALGASWRPAKSFALTLSFDTRNSEGDGEVDLFLQDAPIVPTAARFEEERVGGTLQLKLGGGSYWARLRARTVTADSDRTEERGDFFQDFERTTDSVDARLDAAVRFADSWELSGWARHQNNDVDVDLIDLWSGYATGDWESETTSGSVALAYRDGNVRAALSATTASTDIDTDAPWFDPIFDPSQDLFPVSGDESLRRWAGSLLWTFENGSFWLEAGWLEAEYTFDDTVEPTGFALVSEIVSGTLAVVGAEFGVWKGGRLRGHLEWVEDSDDIDNEILRGHLQVDHEFGSNLAIFGRWAYWDFTDNLAPSDEYTVNLLAAGVRVKF